MSQVDILEATPELIKRFYGHLRELDRVEVEAGGLTTTQALWRSYKRSHYCKVALVDGEPAAVWGVGGLTLDLTGIAWLLTTPQMERVDTLTITQIGRAECANMLKLYPVLENFVLQRYEAAVRFLTLLGFEIAKEYPLVIRGEQFIKMRVSLGG